MRWRQEFASRACAPQAFVSPSAPALRSPKHYIAPVIVVRRRDNLTMTELYDRPRPSNVVHAHDPPVVVAGSGRLPVLALFRWPEDLVRGGRFRLAWAYPRRP